METQLMPIKLIEKFSKVAKKAGYEFVNYEEMETEWEVEFMNKDREMFYAYFNENGISFENGMGFGEEIRDFFVEFDELEIKEVDGYDYLV